MFYKNDGNKWENWVGRGAGGSGWGPTTDGNADSNDSIWEYTSSTTAQVMYMNGKSIATSSYTYVPNTAASLHIGAGGGGGTFAYWDGTIGEVVIAPGVVGSSDRQKIEGYLAWKWGLQGNLPTANHDYKNAPPMVIPEGTGSLLLFW